MENLHPIWLVAIAGALAFLPLFTGLLTSYIKISVVLSMLRTGIGSQQVPGNLVIMALSLACTLYVMQPVFVATAPHLSTLSSTRLDNFPADIEYEKIADVFKPWRDFLQKHAGEREIYALTHLPVASVDESFSDSPVQAAQVIPIRVLLPAFVLSELKEAFAMGFVLLLPFVVIDLIVANILAGLGMFMVSPMVISLPLKLLLFVVADGWILLTQGLIASYQY